MNARENICEDHCPFSERLLSVGVGLAIFANLSVVLLLGRGSYLLFEGTTDPLFKGGCVW